MPYKEKEIEKVHFKVSEVSKLLNVHPATIRFWDKTFKEIKPRRDSNNVRVFIKKDIELVQYIHFLIKIEGYKLKGVKKILEECPSSREMITRCELLKIKDKLL